MLHLRTMTPDDVDFGLRLKEQAGWNQTRADWERMLAMQPEGCFVAQWEGRPAGTAVACVFGKVAWIAMVLVEPSLRGKGIGTALLKQALEFAAERGAASVRLDATPLGQPLYEKLGFAPQYPLQRYAGRLLTPSTPSLPSDDGQIRAATPADYSRLVEWDCAATHTDRSRFLLRLFTERPDNVWVAEEGATLRGFLAVRRGSGALQLGPCIADRAAGQRLFTHAWRELAGQAALIDLPTDHQSAARLVQSAGLAPQRPLLRMCRGPAVTDDLALLWSSSGPELG